MFRPSCCWTVQVQDMFINNVVGNQQLLDSVADDMVSSDCLTTSLVLLPGPTWIGCLDEEQAVLALMSIGRRSCKRRRRWRSCSSSARAAAGSGHGAALPGTTAGLPPPYWMAQVAEKSETPKRFAKPAELARNDSQKGNTMRSWIQGQCVSSFVRNQKGAKCGAVAKGRGASGRTGEVKDCNDVTTMCCMTAQRNRCKGQCNVWCDAQFVMIGFRLHRASPRTITLHILRASFQTFRSVLLPTTTNSPFNFIQAASYSSHMDSTLQHMRVLLLSAAYAMRPMVKNGSSRALEPTGHDSVEGTCSLNLFCHLTCLSHLRHNTPKP